MSLFPKKWSIPLKQKIDSKEEMSLKVHEKVAATPPTRPSVCLGVHSHHASLDICVSDQLLCQC